MSDGKGNGYAGRDTFFAKSERRWTDHVQEDFGTLCLRNMTARQWSSIEADGQDNKLSRKDRIARLKVHSIIATAVDGPETDNLLFTEDDADRLLDLDAGVIDSICNAIVKFCGLGGSAIDDAEKN